jgi:hypothetical protein
MPPPLDQKGWEALTVWSQDAPTLTEAWAALTSDQLPTGFVTTVRTLNHPFLRRLQNSEGLVDAAPAATLERRAWNNRFANLVSGRFSELLFARTYSAMLGEQGLELRETTAEHDWLDYLIVQDAEKFALGINVKNAGVQFETAQERVGLASEDTLPIATYKIFGSTAKEGHIPLIYVYLVDWSLLSRLRAAYWEALTEAERTAFRLMTSFRGMPRKVEDAFITSTVDDRLETLYTGVGYTEDSLPDLPFRAISGRRCQRIFYLDHGRAPYVYVQRMNTDPNVHVSVSKETIHFTEFVERWLSSTESRTELLAGLSRTEMLPIPDPPV